MNFIKVFILLVFGFHSVSAQVDSKDKIFSIDTLKFNSRKIKVVYVLKKTNNLKDKFFNKRDLIFSDSTNNISKMFITNEYYQVDSISTIPIDNVIIDDTKELILCLSRAEVSPYHILLYDFKGKLLFKKKILPLELKMNSIGYKRFKDSFPNFFKYARENKQITKTDNFYYVDLNYWHSLSENEKERIKTSDWFVISHYFPGLLSKNFDGTLPFELSKYAYFYSQTDPFYKYELRNGKLVFIILNDEYGVKVKIPITNTIKCLQ